MYTTVSRVMELSKLLNEHPDGLSKEEIYQRISSYRAVSPLSRDKMLRRDLNALGVASFKGEKAPRYRIRES